MTEASLDAGQDTMLFATEPIVPVEAVSPFAGEAAQRAEEPESEGGPSECRQSFACGFLSVWCSLIGRQVLKQDADPYQSVTRCFTALVPSMPEWLTVLHLNSSWLALYAAMLYICS